MRNIYLFVFLLLIITGINTLSVFSQTTYSYRYDLSGNRISRTIDLSKSLISKNMTSSATEVQPSIEIIAGHSVHIYPNPTKGKITIRMKGLTDDTGFVKVFDMRGKMVSSSRFFGNEKEIDLSSQASGMYIMKVTIGEQTIDWKIIKD